MRSRKESHLWYGGSYTYLVEKLNWGGYCVVDRKGSVVYTEDDSNHAENAIQYAIDNLPSEGGIIQFTTGVFKIQDTVYFNECIRFIGQSIRATKLELVGDCNMFEWRGGRGENEFFCEWHSLWMYGNRDTRNKGWAIDCPSVEGFNLVDSRIVDCYIDNFYDGGVFINNAWGWVIDRCAIEHHRGYALKVQAGGGLWLSNSKYSANRDSSVVAGTYLQCDRPLISNCQFESNGARGLVLGNVGGGVIGNCYFKGNGEDLGSMRESLVLYNSENVLIENCLFDGYNGYIHQQTTTYGIRVQSTCSNIFITDNRFYNHVNGAILDEANSIIRHNIGYATENSGTATIANGNSSVTVNHGLAEAPSVVKLTGTHSEVKDCWVTDVTSTQFTIHASANVTADREVYWEAKV